MICIRLSDLIQLCKRVAWERVGHSYLPNKWVDPLKICNRPRYFFSIHLCIIRIYISLYIRYNHVVSVSHVTNTNVPCHLLSCQKLATYKFKKINTAKWLKMPEFAFGHTLSGFKVIFCDVRPPVWFSSPYVSARAQCQGYQKPLH